jgi:hypothetical protein
MGLLGIILILILIRTFGNDRRITFYASLGNSLAAALLASALSWELLKHNDSFGLVIGSWIGILFILGAIFDHYSIKKAVKDKEATIREDMRIRSRFKKG